MFNGRGGDEGGRRGWCWLKGDYGGGGSIRGKGDGPLRLRLKDWEGRGRGRKDWIPYFMGVVLDGDGSGDQGGRVDGLGGEHGSGDGGLPTIVDGEGDEG